MAFAYLCVRVRVSAHVQAHVHRTYLKTVLPTRN
jgi:hypothetical protein